MPVKSREVIMLHISKARWTVLLLFCLLAGVAWSQLEFFHLKGLQFNSSGGGVNGSGCWSYERYSYYSDPLEPLRIISVRWQLDAWMEPDLETHQDNTYAFLGLVDYDPAEVLVRSPGYDHTGGNSYRVSRISNSGHYLEDRFSENPWAPYAQVQIRYFYNSDLCLVQKTRRVNWPLEFWNYEYTLDHRGRRLSETISSSYDSLNWTPRHSYEYIYGDEAVPDGYEFEKYSSYVPWRHTCGSPELPPFPYLNDSQVISSILRREYLNGAWTEPDTLSLDLTFSAEGASATCCDGHFTWTSEGLPKSSELAPDADPYLKVTFTFGYSGNSAVSDPLIPAALSLRVSPNPLQDKAWVHFHALPDGPVGLKLYNLRGQLLREDAFPELPAGSANLELPTVDSRGERLPNGIYILRVGSSKSSETARFLLLR